MNMRAALTYHLDQFKRAAGIFYLVIVLLNVTFLIPLILFASSSVIQVDSNGFETATMIFLFVCGLNLFKTNFRFFLQNGCSRKKLLLSQVLSVLIIAAGMALIDRVISLILQGIASATGRLSTQGLFQMIYTSHFQKAGALHMHVEEVLFGFGAYTAVFFLGYLITIAYYRMNKAGIIATSVGIPVFLFMVIPLLEVFVTHGKIMNTIVRIVRFAFGFDNGGNPYYALATCIIAAACFAGLSWLLIRRAVIKE